MHRKQIDTIVIGAGISGLATLKCLLDTGLNDVLLLERSDSVGGLWKYRESDAYGVMAFTHINVSKSNYCFSDFPFPAEGPDFPHHSQMNAYINSYAEHFNLMPKIRFNEEVISITFDENSQKFHIRTKSHQVEQVYETHHVAVASGHHVSACRPEFPGLADFNGTVIHSSEFKSASINSVKGPALVVGIGNSAVDVAAELARSSDVNKVFLSTRSGAWVLPNYVLGLPTDLYACRFFLSLPWWIGTRILELVTTTISGHPERWGLNPKMHALQTQPTVSPTLIHHIQRGEVEVVPNVKSFESHMVILEDGRKLKVDQIVLCTGYHIGFPFLDDSVRRRIINPSTNEISLYKNVFAPDLGHRLAFIGYVQPTSGGLLPVSEIQARWFAEVIKGRVKLPKRQEMEASINRENSTMKRRYYKSPRHTIQREPLTYCDDIASKIGAKPSFWRHPRLAWTLLFGSCGTAQWRLQGPNAWPLAEKVVRDVPVTPMMNLTGWLVVTLFLLTTLCVYKMLSFLC